MLFKEADDEEEEMPANRKRIKLKASDGRRSTYTKDADITLDDEKPEGDAADEPTDDGGEVPEEPTTDDTEYAEEDGEGAEGDTDDVPEEPATDDTDYSGDGEMTDDGTDDGGEVPEEPTMDETDYSGEGDGENTDGDTESGDGNSGDGNGSGANKDEQILKYMLYQKFQELDKLLKHYSETFSNMVTDDININQKYKKIANNIKELNRMLSEYMIMKFLTASYAQSRLCYQRIVTATDINLNALYDMKKEIAKNAEE